MGHFIQKMYICLKYRAKLSKMLNFVNYSRVLCTILNGTLYQPREMSFLLTFENMQHFQHEVPN